MSIDTQSALAKLDTARRAIVEVKTIPDAKKLLDEFSTLLDYAKRQRMELEVQNEVAECRIWTRRKLGAMLKETINHEGGRPKNGSTLEPFPDVPPTLSDMGISKAESSRMQTEAIVPHESVLEYVQFKKDNEEEITSSDIYKMAQKLKPSSSESKPKPHVAQNTGNNEWYTPQKYIDAARTVMGQIDLDPASSDLANQTVQAQMYYTAENDGLCYDWAGRVWMNPPYSSDLIPLFCEKLTEHVQDGDVTQACVLVNNATETGWFNTLLDKASCVCFVKGRIKFIDSAGNPTGAPLQGQAILYMGDKVEQFAQEFSQFGRVLYAR